ncbi:MAG: hydroxymethylglutaryl-CoA synthase [Candidatus Atabeyarchaeum deiterrae]
MVGIVGIGTYVPSYRIKLSEILKASNYPPPLMDVEKAVPSTDEDVVTMAAEAATNAVRHSGISPEKVEAVYVGTTSSPYADRTVSTTIAAHIGVPSSATLMEFGGSARAGTSALLACMDLINAGRAKYGLVIGTDSLLGSPGSTLEFYSGAGAGAVMLGKENAIAEIEGATSSAYEFADRWRRSADAYERDSGDDRFAREYGYTKAVVEAASGLIKKLGKTSKDFRYVVQQMLPFGIDPSKGIDASKKVGFDMPNLMPGITFNVFGETGAAYVLLGLAQVFEQAKPNERIMLLSYGAGCSDAISLKLLPTAEAKKNALFSIKNFQKSKETINYIQYAKLKGVISASP